jgi:imidazolonepropionase-like amidohydrolase
MRESEEHVLALDFAEDAVEAGADGLEHIFADQPPLPDFASTVKNHQVFVTPTLTAVQSLSQILTGEELANDQRLKPYLSSKDIGNLRSTLTVQRDSRMNYRFAEQAVRELHATGVPILAGTDAPLQGTVWGASLHRELQLLVQAGMTPSDALSSATSVPARIFGPCCGLGNRGRIAAGMRADLLLVRGDPTRI